MRAPRPEAARPPRIGRVACALALALAAALPVWAGERWGWLGVRIRDLSEREAEELSAKLGLAEGYGVVIEEVLKDTPAEAAGLRKSDLVVAIEGRPVVETRALQRIVGDTAAGRELRLVVLREAQRHALRVRVGQMPPDVVAERVAAEFGFFVREGEEAAPGAVVGAVAERSPAWRGGLRAGDRILAVNGEAVGSVEAVRRRLQDILLRDEIRLRVGRQGEPVPLVLPPAKPALLPQ